MPQPEDVLHREVQAERDQLPANNLLDAILASQPPPGHPIPKLFGAGPSAFQTGQVLDMECKRSFSQRMLHLCTADNQGPQHRNQAHPTRPILREKSYLRA